MSGSALPVACRPMLPPLSTNVIKAFGAWLTTRVNVTGDEETVLPAESARAMKVLTPSLRDTGNEKPPLLTATTVESVPLRNTVAVVTVVSRTTPYSVRCADNVLYPPSFVI